MTEIEQDGRLEEITQEEKDFELSPLEKPVEKGARDIQRLAPSEYGEEKSELYKPYDEARTLNKRFPEIKFGVDEDTYTVTARRKRKPFRVMYTLVKWALVAAIAVGAAPFLF